MEPRVPWAVAGMCPGIRCENGRSCVPWAAEKDLGFVKKFHSYKSLTWDMHSRQRCCTGRSVVMVHSRYIVMLCSVASGMFGVTCSRPEIKAPEDCWGESTTSLSELNYIEPFKLPSCSQGQAPFCCCALIKHDSPHAADMEASFMPRILVQSK